MPTDWEQTFDKTKRTSSDATLSSKLDELLEKALTVSYIRNQEENAQAHFSANLTDFSKSGVTIRLNFSDPLYVS